MSGAEILLEPGVFPRLLQGQQYALYIFQLLAAAVDLAHQGLFGVFHAGIFFV